MYILNIYIYIYIYIYMFFLGIWGGTIEHQLQEDILYHVPHHNSL